MARISQFTDMSDMKKMGGVLSSSGVELRFRLDKGFGRGKNEDGKSILDQVKDIYNKLKPEGIKLFLEKYIEPDIYKQNDFLFRTGGFNEYGDDAGWESNSKFWEGFKKKNIGKDVINPYMQRAMGQRNKKPSEKDIDYGLVNIHIEEMDKYDDHLSDVVLNILKDDDRNENDIHHVLAVEGLAKYQGFKEFKKRYIDDSDSEWNNDPDYKLTNKDFKQKMKNAKERAYFIDEDKYEKAQEKYYKREELEIKSGILRPFEFNVHLKDKKTGKGVTFDEQENAYHKKQLNFNKKYPYREHPEQDDFIAKETYWGLKDEHMGKARSEISFKVNYATPNMLTGRLYDALTKDTVETANINKGEVKFNTYKRAYANIEPCDLSNKLKIDIKSSSLYFRFENPLPYFKQVQEERPVLFIGEKQKKKWLEMLKFYASLNEKNKSTYLDFTTKRRNR